MTPPSPRDQLRSTLIHPASRARTPSNSADGNVRASAAHAPERPSRPRQLGIVPLLVHPLQQVPQPKPRSSRNLTNADPVPAALRHSSFPDREVGLASA